MGNLLVADYMGTPGKYATFLLHILLGRERPRGAATSQLRSKPQARVPRGDAKAGESAYILAATLV